MKVWTVQVDSGDYCDVKGVYDSISKARVKMIALAAKMVGDDGTWVPSSNFSGECLKIVHRNCASNVAGSYVFIEEFKVY